MSGALPSLSGPGAMLTREAARKLACRPLLARRLSAPAGLRSSLELVRRRSHGRALIRRFGRRPRPLGWPLALGGLLLVAVAAGCTYAAMQAAGWLRP